MAKFTQIPADTFQKLQLNAGLMLKNFDPSTGEMVNTDIFGATSGGVNFTATPEFKDYGEEIDNAPKNVLELKRLDKWEAKMAGSFISVDAQTAKVLVGAADIDADDPTKIVPRADIVAEDFQDIWWVGDYSDDNSDETGGFIAIHLINALSSTGFAIQSTDRDKGQFEFEFTGHYSMENQDQVPFEIFVKGGGNE